MGDTKAQPGKPGVPTVTSEIDYQLKSAIDSAVDEIKKAWGAFPAIAKTSVGKFNGFYDSLPEQQKKKLDASMNQTEYVLGRYSTGLNLGQKSAYFQSVFDEVGKDAQGGTTVVGSLVSSQRAQAMQPKSKSKY